MNRRMNLVALLIGTRGTGKTTYIKKLIEESIAEKILIFDTDDNPAFYEFDAIAPNLIPYFRRGIVRVIDTNFDKVLGLIDSDFRNGLVIFEDATKYTANAIPKALNNILVASKQRNVDVLMTFHNFNAVHPQLYTLVNFLEIFKTRQQLAKIASKNKIPRLEDVLRVHFEVEADNNPFFHKTVAL